MLEAAGIPFTVHEYHHDPAVRSYGLEAATALGLDPDQVFKTLLVATDGGDLAVAIVPVSCQLSLKAVGGALGTKRVEMADPVVAQRVTGYVVGGISLLGQRSRMPLFLDDSVLTRDAVYLSAGRRGLQVRVAPADLVRVSGARTAPLGRPG